MNTLYKVIFAAPAAALIGLGAPSASYAGTFSNVGTEEAAPQNCYPQPPKYVARRCETAHATTEQVQMAKFEVVTEEVATKKCYLAPPRYTFLRCD